ncbi:Alpha/Beta hydrolase protein [Calycina marina]|uniref:Alpha/Beta hydrolase protein n=1 Tax=Calycina marina TaxID=1763456 RepID=A0A9P8CBN0_9HELO|nr:Alpha/Beta hydrolase protein [Calycina marina]
MLPSPTLSFTIPSIHDDLKLECRIYHPKSIDQGYAADALEQRRKGAIVAHPYAPLGGCYDDPIVGIVASTILKQGFVVGTFNFRGAGSSKGKTSWQGKAERSDYISFIGFMTYYLNALHPLRLNHKGPEANTLRYMQSEATDTEQRVATPHTHHPLLLLAGYSYGALITTTLPPILSSVLGPFQTPTVGNAYAEIRLRASHLASQQNNVLKFQLQSMLSSPVRGRRHPADDQFPNSPRTRTVNGVRVGGDEDIRRASHESYRSRTSFVMDTPERVRRSVDRMRHMRRSRCAGSLSLDASASASDTEVDDCPPQSATDDPNKVEAVPGIGENLKVAYLLVSPLRGMISTLVTMGSIGLGRHTAQLTKTEMKLVTEPTLAVYGDDDIFISVKTLRSWVERLGSATTRHNKFRHREVPGAGHFWHDATAIDVLRQEVRGFVSSL